MKLTERIDLGDGYMVVYSKGYYTILTPTSSTALPADKFRAMVARFERKVRENPKNGV